MEVVFVRTMFSKKIMVIFQHLFQAQKTSHLFSVIYIYYNTILGPKGPQRRYLRYMLVIIRIKTIIWFY